MHFQLISVHFGTYLKPFFIFLYSTVSTVHCYCCFMHFLIFTNLQCLLYDPSFFQNCHYSKKMSLCYNLCMYLIVSKLLSWHLKINFLFNSLWFEYHVSVNGRVFDGVCEWCIHVWSTFYLLLISLLENKFSFVKMFTVFRANLKQH